MTAGRAIGTWSGFASITAAVGPVLGGWFTQHGSWRWVFFINVPVVLAVLLLTVLNRSRLDNHRAGVDASLDLVPLGAVTARRFTGRLGWLFYKASNLLDA